MLDAANMYSSPLNSYKVSVSRRSKTGWLTVGEELRFGPVPDDDLQRHCVGPW